MSLPACGGVGVLDFGHSVGVEWDFIVLICIYLMINVVDLDDLFLIFFGSAMQLAGL